MKKAKEINVLYVDDETNNLNSFKATFRKEFNVLIGGSAAEGLDLMKSNTVHIVITDHRMPGIAGVDFLVEIKERYPDTVRILLTGFTELTAIAEAVSKGEVHYRMEKPWDEEQVRGVINAAYEIYFLRKMTSGRQ
nr:response regulator [uncultured Dyadobacter sp.]